MTDTLSQRNTAAFQQAIKQLQEQGHAQAEEIVGLRSGLAALSTRLVEVERQLAVQRAASTGTGPTVR